MDVRKAYLYAKATRRVYVEIPEEDKPEEDGDACGLLHFSLHGTRDAAQNCEAELGKQLVAQGHQKGTASPSIDSSAAIKSSVWGIT